MLESKTTLDGKIVSLDNNEDMEKIVGHPIGPVHPEDKKIIERVLNNEPPIPLRNDRPVEYELNVRCEDGFTIGFKTNALGRIVKAGYLEDRIRQYRNALEEKAEIEAKINADRIKVSANTGTSSEQV